MGSGFCSSHPFVFYIHFLKRIEKRGEEKEKNECGLQGAKFICIILSLINVDLRNRWTIDGRKCMKVLPRIKMNIL